MQERVNAFELLSVIHSALVSRFFSVLLGGEGSALAVGSLSHPEPLNSKSGTASWKDLLFCQHPQELCVPGAEQGLPEPDACAMEQLEALDSAQSAGSLQGTGSACPEEASAAGAPRSCVFLEGRPPETSPLQPQQLQKRFPSHGLLLSPAPESTGSQLESQLPTLVFPLVGATPASQPLAGESPLQVKGSRPRPPGGARQRPAEAVGMRLEESQVPASQSVELCKASPRQVMGCQLWGVAVLCLSAGSPGRRQRLWGRTPNSVASEGLSAARLGKNPYACSESGPA